MTADTNGPCVCVTHKQIAQKHNDAPKFLSSSSGKNILITLYCFLLFVKYDKVDVLGVCPEY